jgi:hypothetical protein
VRCVNPPMMDTPDVIPVGLVRVETPLTLQGFALVVPGSPDHEFFAGATLVDAATDPQPGTIADPAAYAAAVADGTVTPLPKRPRKGKA